nr:hypothetical protein [Tanacetum cinerariifolium]
YNLITAESKFKNLVLDHQDKYMMKAQVHMSTSSAISDEQALPRRKHYCQIYQIINFTSGIMWIQQYLQNEHYALWKVIEFVDFYEAPQDDTATGSASEGSAKKKGRTVAVTTEDMQKMRNDVKARTTLLLAFLDEHQLRFSKYKTDQELWAAILKKFGKDPLEQTFNRLQAIVSHLEFMDVEIEQDDLNQKFLTSLALEWLMYTIMWRNRSGLDTMSLDDVYNHLKVYEPEVQKKSESNTQNMAFISSAKNSRGNREVNTASILTASTQVSPARANKKTGKKISIQGTDVAGFDKSKVECFNCHKMGQFPRECRAPRSQDRGRRENFKQGSKVEESTPKALMAIDGVVWDWSYMANEEEDQALVAEQEALTEFALMAKSSSDTENGESTSSIISKPKIKFVKAADSPTVIKTSKDETVRKPYIKYAEMYRKTSKSSNVRGESMLWHRRLGHLNFKTMNSLVRHNLVKGLPSKCFDNDHTCVACLKGKQHKASCKTKLVNLVSKPLRTLHMDLFGPTSDETSGILKNSITEIENLKELKVKIIKCDNGGEFRNKEMNDFCSRKRIKREFSNARTPQQNRVTERRNRRLIEAARTMLADAKLPVTFWAEAVNTACYVQNRVLVNKSQNKTLYELFNGRTLAIGFLKPFGCHVMILNTLDHLGKFEVKGDEGYFIGYSMSSKAFRVFNKRTKRVEENLHVDFLENKLIEKGASPNWLFDIDTLTNSMNYVPVIALLNWFHEAHLEASTSNAQDACKDDTPESSGNFNPTTTLINPPTDDMDTLTVETLIPTVSSPVLTACLNDSPKPSSNTRLISKRITSQDDTPSLDNILTLSNRFEDILGVTTNTGDSHRVEANLGNMENNISASPTPTFRIHKDHPKSQIIGLVDTLVQTRTKSKEMEEQSFIASIHHMTNPDLLQFCLFLFFLSQEEPKKIFDALKDPSWVEAMQEELLQFKIQNVWSLVDCPEGVRPIGTKWVLKNKKDERGILIRNKARLVAQGHTQEEGIDYKEVFAPVLRIKAIRLFLAYASFMGFTVYQMDVKSAFLYGTIDEEVYVMQPPGF